MNWALGVEFEVFAVIKAQIGFASIILIFAAFKGDVKLFLELGVNEVDLLWV